MVFDGFLVVFDESLVVLIVIFNLTASLVHFGGMA